MLIAMVEQGCKAEAVLDTVNRTIDSITNTAVFLAADWIPKEKCLKNNSTLTITLSTYDGKT
jgi:hypothetical protein